MDQLAAMRSFVQVVDRGGLAPAGRHLGLSAPMVGNHLRFLEARLGGLLLNRTTRAQSLTELGRAYLARCRSVIAELEAADGDAAELLGAPRGCIRIAAPHTIGTTLLPPIIARFLERHAGVSIDLRLDNQRAGLLPDGFDAAIRVGELEDAALVTRMLGRLELVPCAAPAYLQRRGAPATPAELARHECLDFSASATPGCWEFEADGRIVSVPVSGRLRADSGAALLEIAREGLGIIMQPEVLVRDDIANGRLVPLLPAFPARRRPVQLLTLPGQQAVPKIRALADHLVERFDAGGPSRASHGKAPM